MDGGAEGADASGSGMSAHGRPLRRRDSAASVVDWEAAGYSFDPEAEREEQARLAGHAVDVVVAGSAVARIDGAEGLRHGSDSEVTAADVQRVREWECRQEGHDLSFVTRFGRLWPVAILCDRCGKSQQLPEEEPS